MKLELKAIKTFRGMEGHGLNATLYVDGVKAADVIDEGNGGDLHVMWFVVGEIVRGNNWHDTPISRRVYAAIDKLIPEPVAEDAEEWEKDLGAMKPTLDILVSRMVDTREEGQRINRMLKTKVMFTLPNMPKGHYQTCTHYGAPDKAKAAMLKKYPNATFIEVTDAKAELVIEN